MNRVDRLLALIIELRGRGTVRAEDLAQTFGTSKRTIYRDMQALSEAGVPVVSLNGQGYQIESGYFLPPLAFTEEEAGLVLLGLSATATSFDSDYRAISEGAQRKIRGVLSATIREKMRLWENSLMLGNTQTLTPAETEALRTLRRAIIESRTVHFTYFSRHPGDGRVNARDADPYSLVALDTVWYMSGYCHLREERRLFRLSRMDGLRVTSRHFERPADYQMGQEAQRDDRTLAIRVVVSEDALPWVMEDRFYYIDSREPHPDGVLVTLRARNIDEVLAWVLGWGRNVRVIEPLSLVARIREEAEALLNVHRAM